MNKARKELEKEREKEREKLEKMEARMKDFKKAKKKRKREQEVVVGHCRHATSTRSMTSNGSSSQGSWYVGVG